MSAKDTFFCQTSTLNIKGSLLVLDRPKVMGILNTTPDSFYDGGQLGSTDQAVDQAGKMLDAGATFLDVGGYSTRPGAEAVSEQQELDRVVPAIEAIAAAFPAAVISVDTFRSAVARAAVEAGAAMVNDISAGNLDPKLLSTVAELQVPYVLMHMQGTPATMQANPQYDDPVGEVFKFFTEKLHTLRALGIHDVLIDPGFGFGKTVEHNYALLNALPEFQSLGPVLVGVSRKSMINKVLKTTPDKALNGTTALNTIALMKGACILRVHDVEEAVQAVRLVETLAAS